MSNNLTGTLKSFNQSNPEKAFGFIACPELFAQYKSDVFLQGAAFPEELRKTISIGDPVTFGFKLSVQKKPQAIRLKPLVKTGVGILKSFNVQQGYGFVQQVATASFFATTTGDSRHTTEFSSVSFEVTMFL